VTTSAKEPGGRPDTIAGLWAQAVHDLRQPVQAALLLAGMLDGVSERAELERAARGIGSALESLHDMLEILTLLVRMEAGLHSVPLRTCQLAEDLQPALRELLEVAAGRGILLRVRKLQGAVRSNPRLLAAAARSLVLNAIRFGNGGDILVGCRRGGDHLRLEVRFSGTALDAASEKHAFVQLPPRGEPLIAGELGLGLALLRPLCRALGAGLQHKVSAPDAQLLTLTLPLAGSPALPR
jgi:signal transduction histidine kinase